MPPALEVEQARKPGPFADVKPEPPPMSRVTSDERCIQRMPLFAMDLFDHNAEVDA